MSGKSNSISITADDTISYYQRHKTIIKSRHRNCTTKYFIVVSKEKDDKHVWGKPRELPGFLLDHDDAIKALKYAYASVNLVKFQCNISNLDYYENSEEFSASRKIAIDFENEGILEFKKSNPKDPFSVLRPYGAGYKRTRAILQMSPVSRAISVQDEVSAVLRHENKISILKSDLVSVKQNLNNEFQNVGSVQSLYISKQKKSKETIYMRVMQFPPLAD